MTLSHLKAISIKWIALKIFLNKSSGFQLVENSFELGNESNGNELGDSFVIHLDQNYIKENDKEDKSDTKDEESSIEQRNEKNIENSLSVGDINLNQESNVYISQKLEDLNTFIST